MFICKGSIMFSELKIFSCKIMFRHLILLNLDDGLNEW